ncbi:hypothetical protein QN386_25555, partial [Pseudomonas sp. CCI3.2]|uniref:hypothetical protein n=1 Tax=unclassified Pseudomonas TaxID=196821 RepID=UPI002B238909
VFDAALSRSKLGGTLYGLRLQRVRTDAFPNKFGPTDFGAAQISEGGAEGCDQVRRSFANKLAPCTDGRLPVDHQ